MAQYSTNNRQAGAQQNMTAAFKTLLQLSAATATLRRSWMYEVEVGADGVPNVNDCAIVWDFSRSSTIGSATPATPSPLDLADPASGTVCNVNHTVEPTIGVSLMSLALNQRNSQRWVARDDKAALIVPATNLAGISARALSSAYTSTGVITGMFAE
jgi:hypothetical protein